MGHGDACALLSGHITQLTSVYFQCSLHSQFIAPAGPAGNYLAGCVAWLAGMALPPGAVRARLYALLVMAFSFFWEAGYLIFAMATGHGDYVYAAQDFLGGPAWIWRAGGILLGIALYRLFGHFLGARLRAFGRAEGRIRRLLPLAWAAAILTSVGAAAFYAPGRLDAMVQAAGEIGGAFPLLFRVHAPAAADAEVTPAIVRSRVWIVAALVTFVVFAATLGRGLP